MWRWFVLLSTFFLILGCESRDYSGQFRTQATTFDSFSTEVRPLLNPNAYEVLLSWKNVFPVVSTIYRAEADGPFTYLNRTSVEDGSVTDQNVEAGKKYRYRLNPSDETREVEVVIPVDYYVSEKNSIASGEYKGFNRLFLSDLLATGSVRIEVNEIILTNGSGSGRWIGSILNRNFLKRFNDPGKDGEPGLNVFIRANRMTGELLQIVAQGQDGGKGPTKGGASGSVDIEIKEYTPAKIVTVTGRSRNGDELSIVPNPDRMGPLSPIVLKVGNQEIRFAQNQLYPGNTGLHKLYPLLLVTADGYGYQIELVDEEKPFFQVLGKKYLLESYTHNTDGRLYLNNGEYAGFPLNRDAFKGPWLALHDFTEALKTFQIALTPRIDLSTVIPLSIDVPQQFSPDLSVQTENLKKLNGAPERFKKMAAERAIQSITVSLEANKKSEWKENELVIGATEIEFE